MPLNQKDCEKVLAEMTPERQAQFLARLGHMYTVYGRDAYEFQGPGVTKPRLLRDFNEVHHRLYAQLGGLLTRGEGVFSPEVLAIWICGEGRDEEFRVASLDAFERCLKNFNAA
ncbi:hypothetical protein GTP55_13280 [Duganella sp. FT109W]|uniref:Uncharacterized protein n=1 Tax=Duganella margarita TaxID=2692170 RepID=A0ABW9WH00_9BURK|nr:hypothetical protein [Duganella margarita]MYN40348.1 hypothetical protein [Duganella margarita]